MSLADRSPKALTAALELDYVRRARWPDRLRISAALAGAAIALVAVIGISLGRSGVRAFQAGPVAGPHALFADDCAQCHAQSFRTAAKFWPGAPISAVRDEDCLKCHQAGEHAANQLRYSGAAGQSAGCAGCHREHHGQSLTRLPDQRCTECHTDLPRHTNNGQADFAASISSFADHPSFGAWRKAELRDPGTIRFNHRVHVNLPESLKSVSAERQRDLQPALDRLSATGCQACHEPDAERRSMQPVRYDAHCQNCHPLRVPIVGNWTDPETVALAAEFGRQALHHPHSGEDAATVRGEILARLFAFLSRAKIQPPGSRELVRPALLERPLTRADKEWLDARRRNIEADLYRGEDRLVRSGESFLWDRAGCAFCHTERDPTKRPDGLPQYEPPRLRERWADEQFPAGRLHRVGAEIDKTHWFPFARFRHDSHRAVACLECHHGADASTAASDLLLPTIEDCRKCHAPAVGVRSDCLTCHQYHDRTRESRGLNGALKVSELLGGR